MTANEKNRQLANRIYSRTGIELPDEYQTAMLRRAALTLQRWAELECGDGDEYKSWSIERNEETGKPFMCIYPHNGNQRSWPVADREAGALRRVKAFCENHGLYFFHQTDPRGCSLYVFNQPLTDTNYTMGVAVY